MVVCFCAAAERQKKYLLQTVKAPESDVSDGPASVFEGWAYGYTGTDIVNFDLQNNEGTVHRRVLDAEALYLEEGKGARMETRTIRGILVI